MRARFKKNKGATLIEVLISIAIFTVISIPLSMTVISSIANNKKGENKQYAVAVAQQIIEKLRATNTTIPNIVTIKTDNTYNLNFLNMATPSTGHDLGYSASNATVGNGFEADVTFQRKLPYDRASTITSVVEYDLSVLMDSNSIKVTGTNNDTGITGDALYSLTDDLIICNKDNHTIQFKKNNSTKDVLGTYKPYNISVDALIDNIKISYSSNYGPHTIYFENNATNPLSVYIFKQGNENENTYTNSMGSIKFYDNLSSSPIVTDNTSGVYDINVEIYKGQSPNKVKIYSTKTSISLGM